MRNKIARFFKRRFSFNWSFIFLLILVVGLADFLLIYGAKIEKEENFSYKKIKRIGPVYTRGIYLSSWTVSDLKNVDKMVNLILKNKLNTVVIDLKDSKGVVPYDSKVPEVNLYKTKKIRIKNLSSVVEKFSNHHIYTIARIPVFQDTELAQKKSKYALKNRLNGKIWRDWKGLAWVDPAAKDVWDYNIKIAQEAFKLGFDEVNFDYVRFPSDGNIGLISYPFWDKKIEKAEIIRQFSEYQHNQLKKYGPTSIDIFGLVLWHNEDNYDMNIGQKLSVFMPYFDYICPMVYPSHFPSGFQNFKNPAAYPYDIIYQSLKRVEPLFINKKVKLRPWLQVFDLGTEYTPAMILKEITAVQDAHAFGYLFWNSKNDYSPLYRLFQND
ncbi:hypothetical protein J7K86_01920 [bacterium]|nr:hypothetical protein [bacterium]